MEKNQLELYQNLKETNTLSEIQQYIENVITLRGFSKENIEKTMLLLTEEIGELAKAIRKENTPMGIDKNKITNYNSVENEIADVFIVLCTICNKLNIDLFTAIKNKENENIKRIWNK